VAHILTIWGKMTENLDSPAQPRQTSFGWERLITEGHVRAARLRSARPFFIWPGVALVALGVLGFLYLSAPSHTDAFDPAQIVLSKAENYRRPVLQKIDAMRFPRRFNDEDVSKIATSEKLARAIQNILASLDEKDAFPNDGFQTLQPSEFWDKPWPQDVPVTTAFVVNKGELMALGAYANAGDAENPELKPWIGLFKKQDDKMWGLFNWMLPENKGKWMVVSLKDGSFYAHPDKPVVSAQDVAVSLRALMDMEDER